MATIFMDFDDGVPRLAYTGCAWCSSAMGISLCQTKKRGCCSYFPKFYPVELQRMSLSSEGLECLARILSIPGTVLHDDHIHAKGTFDVALHDKMLRAGLLPINGGIQDTTLYFRTCPFVQDGSGCTLPARFRCYVCNFFVCREVLENPAYKALLEPYIHERANYVRFLEWENKQLIAALRSEGLSVRENLKDVLQFLASIPVNQYAYPVLEPVEIPEEHNIQAV